MSELTITREAYDKIMIRLAEVADDNVRLREALAEVRAAHQPTFECKPWAEKKATVWFVHCSCGRYSFQSRDKDEEARAAAEKQHLRHVFGQATFLAALSHTGEEME